MKIETLNIRSVNNKIDDVHEVMLNHHLSAQVLTETRHEDSECVTAKKIRSLGYNLIEAARPIKPATKHDNIHFVNHGGVAIMSRLGVKITKLNVKLKVSTFELREFSRFV